MADRSSVCMLIGGTIHRRDVKKLRDAAIEDYAGINYEGGDDADLAEWIDNAPSHDRGVLTFTGSEVSWGRFEQLEAVCKELRLTYCTQSDACSGAWSASADFWEPDIEDDCSICFPCDDDGMPLLSTQSIRRCLADGTLLNKLDQMDRIYRFRFPFVIIEDPEWTAERDRLDAELDEIDAQGGPADVFADRRRAIINRLDEMGA